VGKRFGLGGVERGKGFEELVHGGFLSERGRRE
jgi:hypothetical protein